MLRWVAATAAVLGTLTACSGSGKVPSATADLTDPNSAVHKALGTMEGLNSYRMIMAFSPEGTDIPAQVDFDRSNYDERITDPSSGEVAELIVSDYLYVRHCSDADHCDAWARSAPLSASPGRSLVRVPSLGGFTTTEPETPAFAAVDLATGWHESGASTATLAGQIDLGKTIAENQIRNAIAAGYTRSEAQQLIADPLAEPSPTGVPQSTIELEFSPDDYPYFKSVRIGVPGDDTNPYFVVSFSRFNDVSVEAPADYTMAPAD